MACGVVTCNATISYSNNCIHAGPRRKHMRSESLFYFEINPLLTVPECSILLKYGTRAHVNMKALNEAYFNKK